MFVRVVVMLGSCFWWICRGNGGGVVTGRKQRKNRGSFGEFLSELLVMNLLLIEALFILLLEEVTWASRGSNQEEEEVAGAGDRGR